MLFARQRDLPFTELTVSILTKSRGADPRGRAADEVPAQAQRILRPDTRTARGAGRAGSTVAVAIGAEDGTQAPGALFARKRIEHAIELFGACMFIAFALALALFA